MIELSPDDDGHVLVTFLWRAAGEIRNVVVAGGPAAFNDVTGSQMACLPDRVHLEIVESDLRPRSQDKRRTLRCQNGAKSRVMEDRTRPQSALVCHATAVAGPFQPHSTFLGCTLPDTHILTRRPPRPTV